MHTPFYLSLCNNMLYGEILSSSFHTKLFLLQKTVIISWFSDRLLVQLKLPSYGVFTLTETEAETDWIGFYDNVQKSTHCIVPETVANAIGFCTQFHRCRSLSRFSQCKHTTSRLTRV